MLRRTQVHSPELAEVDRDRSLTEIAATAAGIPEAWVNQAREAGTAGRAWKPGTALRELPRNNVVRRGYSRVVGDTQRLTDMAAVAVVRDRHLHHGGIDTDPEPAVAHQLRRNMDALRTRIIHTAASISMSTAQRVRAMSVTDTQVAECVDARSQLAVEDLTAVWRDFGSPAIAASVRSSLASLRRDAAAGQGAGPGSVVPPTTQERIIRARSHLPPLSTAHDEPSGGEAIERAVHAALSAAEFEPDPDTGGDLQPDASSTHRSATLGPEA
ncbi:hypothetical protein ACIGO9_14930 [Nocardia asteroides]|uniref:hypothetical protein n=1 Tax=Nocardia asteroides TaxID=1824 RepID=UPI0037C84361